MNKGWKWLGVVYAIAVGASIAEITGIVTMPGGKSGQLEYNSNGSSFQGVQGSTVTGQNLALSGNLTVLGTVSGTVTPGSVDLSSVTARFVLVGASTQTLANVVGASTQTLANTVGASTQALANIVGASTQTLAANIGASTQTIVVNVGASTQALANLVGASTQALQVELNSVGSSTMSIAAATTTLYNVRASSGVNADLTQINTALTLLSDLSGKSISLSGGIRGTTASWTSGLDASSVTLHATGAAQYALELSTGIKFDTIRTGIVWADGTVSTTAASGGGGGLSSIKIASGSYVNGATGDENPAQSVQGLYLSTSSLLGFDIHGSSAVLQFKGFVPALATARWNPNGVTAVTAGNVCIPNSTGTWTQGNNAAEVCFAGTGSVGGGAFTGTAAILLDGVIISSVTNGSAGNGSNLSQCVNTGTLSAGSHSACLAAWTTGGTLSIPPSGASAGGSQMWVQEIATVGAGYSAPASTWTVLSPNTEPSTAGTTLAAVAGMPLTYTTSGAPMRFDFDCECNNGNASAGGRLGVQVDSAYIDSENSTNGLQGGDWNSSSSGQVDSYCGFHYTSTTTFAAGSHTVSLMLAAKSAGTVTIKSSKASCMFRASEVRNAAGTGDVCTNCNQTLTGVNTLSVPSTSVSGTTITLNSYNAVPGFTHNLISSQSAAGYSELAFSGLSTFSSSTTWTFEITGNLPTANSRVWAAFNGDLAQANYEYFNFLENSAGTTAAQINGGLARWCLISNNGSLLGAGSEYKVFGTFRAQNPKVKSATMDYTFDDTQNGSNRDHATGKCTYTGSAAINTIQFFFWDPANTGVQSFQGTAKLGVVDN